MSLVRPADCAQRERARARNEAMSLTGRSETLTHAQVTRGEACASELSARHQSLGAHARVRAFAYLKDGVDGVSAPQGLGRDGPALDPRQGTTTINTTNTSTSRAWFGSRRRRRRRVCDKGLGPWFCEGGEDLGPAHDAGVDPEAERGVVEHLAEPAAEEISGKNDIEGNCTPEK